MNVIDYKVSHIHFYVYTYCKAHFMSLATILTL